MLENLLKILNSKIGKEVLGIRKMYKRFLSIFLAACIAFIYLPFKNTALAASERLYGADRYRTAIEISKKGWSSSYYAVLARGDDFPDALCAGPLAKKYNAPILLTEPDMLNANVLTELKRLGVSYVFIIGGAGAVSGTVENAIKNAGISTIERIYGSDRYATSVKIAEKMGWPGKIALATGEDYPDALSVSGVAAQKGMPILLTQKNSLPSGVYQYIKDKSITETFIAGGAGVISDWVKANVPGPIRLSGDDRYQTNVAIMEHFASELDFSSIYVAVGEGPRGDEFADALTGAVLASKTSSPLILTGSTFPLTTANYIKLKLSPVSNVTVLGGEGAVPWAVVNSIESYISGSLSSVASSYNSPGTYGPSYNTTTVWGNVAINTGDVTLQNTIIEGNLILGENIKTGSVYLRNVTVKGITYVRGGGPNSVWLYDVNCPNVIADVPGNSVRIMAQGNTSIGNTKMQCGGKLEEYNLSGNGFTNVAISDSDSVTLSGSFSTVNMQTAGSRVYLESGSISSLNIESGASNSYATITSSANVDTLTMDASSTVYGQGQVYRAYINASSTNIEMRPSNIDIKSGIGAYVANQYVTGSTYYDDYTLYPISSYITINAGSTYYASNNISNPYGASLTYYSDNSNVSVDVYTGLITSSIPSASATITVYGSRSGYNTRTVSFTVYVSIGTPVVTVVENSKTYGAAVTPAWTDASGTTSTATLAKDGAAAATYTKGTPISGDGSYVLVVTARSNANGYTSSTTVSFIIDTVAPAAPVVTAVEEGHVYTASVTPTWTDASGTTGTATLAKDGGVATAYIKGTAISGNGKYVLTVTATKTSNKLTKPTSISFEIDKEPPAAPVVTGVTNNETYGVAVTPTWTDVVLTTSTATLAKDGGAATAYTKGTAISGNGVYVLTVTAAKDSNGYTTPTTVIFTIDTVLPAAPVVTGVAGGQVYTAAVTANWDDIGGATIAATLKKGEEAVQEYTKGAEIKENGDYVLIVTATKTLNKLTKPTTVNFKIDKDSPAAPVVNDVINTKTYGVAVTPTWTDAPLTTSTATLTIVGGVTTAYTKGTAISDNGEYVLTVTAIKDSNKLTIPTTVNFTIDTVPPAAPVVTGVVNNGVYIAKATPKWTDAEGTTSTAILSKDGTVVPAYTNGTEIVGIGSYVLVVTATKTSNNLTAPIIIIFEIN